MISTAWVVMVETFTQDGNDYFPYRVFLSEESAVKWLQDQPDHNGALEYHLEETLLG